MARLSTIGTHYIWDIQRVSAHEISYVFEIRTLLRHICSLTPLTIESESYKQFQPVGATGIMLLSESHLSIHTWPEHEFLAIDLFSCIPVDHQRITDYLTSVLSTDDITIKILERGRVPEQVQAEITIEKQDQSMM